MYKYVNIYVLLCKTCCSHVYFTVLLFDYIEYFDLTDVVPTKGGSRTPEAAV